MPFENIKLLAPLCDEMPTLDTESMEIGLGKKLPNSYVDFINKFGYGKSLGLILIYPAYREFGDSLREQSARISDFIRMAIDGDYIVYEPDGSPKIAKRLFPFAMSENGEYFAWDTGQGENEYPIYCISYRMGAIRYAAGNLYEFIEILSGDGIKMVMGSGYSPLPKIFEPIFVAKDNNM